jgi:putative transposon-encoded protein
MSLETMKLLTAILIVMVGIFLPCVVVIWRNGLKLDKEREARDAAATGDTWCQFCDEIKPTTDFKVDPVGRWACIQCRIDAGFETEEKQKEPAPYPFRRIDLTSVQNYEGHDITLADVPAYTKVKAFGNSCKVDIAGNVGDCALIVAEGNSAEIVIHGDVGSDVTIRALGNSAKIFIEGFIHEQGIVSVDGNSAKIYYRHAHISTQFSARGNSSKVSRSTLRRVC